jgi:hypothetical protein
MKSQSSMRSFQAEDEFLPEKSGMAFSEFEKNVRSSDEERFEMENDYLAWKFACDGIAFPNPKPQTLNPEPTEDKTWYRS